MMVAAVIIFLLLMMLAGMHVGFVKCLVGTAAYVVSAAFSLVITIMFSGIFGNSGKADILCFTAVFLLIYISIAVAGVSLKLLARLPVISTANKVLGGMAGFVLGMLCIFMLLAIAGRFPETAWAQQIADGMEEQEVLNEIYENNFVELLLDKYLPVK